VHWQPGHPRTVRGVHASVGEGNTGEHALLKWAGPTVEGVTIVMDVSGIPQTYEGK
jgi:hypothetical protein